MPDLTLITEDTIKEKIYIIRNQKVILDHDLAELYEVETKQLKRQVRRNVERFPQDDFMFELTREEFRQISRSQNGTLKQGANIKYSPMVFTEQGVSMLSSVLNSSRAIKVNIHQNQSRFSNPDRSLNRKKERFKVFEVEPRLNRGRTVMTS